MSEMISRLQADFFKAVGHPTRVQIIDFLRHGERCVCEIIEELGLEQSNVSQHLAVLKKQDIVAFRKDGMKMMYRLKDPRILDLLDLCEEILAAQFQETRLAFRHLREKEE